jgi:hypothetical protein
LALYSLNDGILPHSVTGTSEASDKAFPLRPSDSFRDHWEHLPLVVLAHFRPILKRLDKGTPDVVALGEL